MITMLYKSPRTFRDYGTYKEEEAYVRGWNEAMDYIFGTDEAAKNKKRFQLIKGDKK